MPTEQPDPFAALGDAIETYAAAQSQYERANGEHHALEAANKAILAAIGPMKAEIEALYARGIAEGLRQAASTIEDSAARLESTNDNTATAIRATAAAWVAGLRISAKLTEGGAEQPAPTCSGCVAEARGDDRTAYRHARDCPGYVEAFDSGPWEPAEQAPPVTHALGCMCGTNDAGQHFDDPICRRTS